jgi:hypothetical protein
VIGIVVTEASEPANVVEVVAHEASHLAGAAEEEALTTGRLIRLSHEEGWGRFRQRFGRAA